MDDPFPTFEQDGRDDHAAGYFDWLLVRNIRESRVKSESSGSVSVLGDAGVNQNASCATASDDVVMR
jgi:hypothetical protein